MIIVNKKEANEIRKKYPDVAIKRTCRQKSKRGRYYCEENTEAMKFLNKLRKRGVVCDWVHHA